MSIKSDIKMLFMSVMNEVNEVYSQDTVCEEYRNKTVTSKLSLCSCYFTNNITRGAKAVYFTYNR